MAPPADADRQLLGLKVLAGAFDSPANLRLRGVEAPKDLEPKGGVGVLGFGRSCVDTHPALPLPSPGVSVAQIRAAVRATVALGK